MRAFVDEITQDDDGYFEVTLDADDGLYRIRMDDDDDLLEELSPSEWVDIEISDEETVGYYEATWLADFGSDDQETRYVEFLL